jgi:Tol biopolymer transport system component
MPKRFGLTACAVLALGGSCLGGENPAAEAAGGPPRLTIASVIEVTDGSTIYMQPVWSPDGKKLAFTRSGFTGLYVRNSDGSGPIQEINSAEYSGYKPVWTSDSKGLVIRTRTGIVGQSITRVDVETGEVTTLAERAAHPGQPERNAYGDVTVDVDGEMKVLDTKTGGLEDLDEYYSAEQLSSLDVRLEIDYRDRRMWIVEGNGTNRVEFPHQVLLASLSPTRDRVAFGKADPNLYVSNLDGSGLVSLGPGERWDWSPDGKRLVYMGAIQQGDGATIASGLFVANTDGSGVVQISDTPDIVEMFPSWSPDGTRIAYSTHRAGKICVAVLEAVQ